MYLYQRKSSFPVYKLTACDYIRDIPLFSLSQTSIPETRRRPLPSPALPTRAATVYREGEKHIGGAPVAASLFARGDHCNVLAEQGPEHVDTGAGRHWVADAVGDPRVHEAAEIQEVY